MIIIGIDPGVAKTGYGVVNKTKKFKCQKLKCLGFGLIETKKDLPFPKRLAILSRGLRKILKRHRPSLAAIETLFFFQNKKTAIKVSQASGVILYTLEQAGIKVKEYSPQEVKKFLCKNGWGKKEEVQKRVKRVLKLKTTLPDDAADALAIAILAAKRLKD